MLCCMQTAWGDHSLSTALKLMITEALKDPFNQQFQLVCPAHDPAAAGAVYLHAAHRGDPQSRRLVPAGALRGSFHPQCSQ